MISFTRNYNFADVLPLLLLFSFIFHANQTGASTEQWRAHDPASTTRIDHSVWDNFLGRYVVNHKDRINRVRYSKVKSDDKEALGAYIDDLSAVEITGYNRDQQRAFWINLYNALTVHEILQHYPVASIRDIRSGFFTPGPWQKELVTVEGATLSLDDIEHAILRPVWADPRIHYAINCASLGCPNLQKVAFTSDNTEALLDQAAFDFINHPRGAWVWNGNLRASSIYKWFQEDFGDSEQSVIAHLRQFADAELYQRLEGITDINDYEYSWELNGLTPFSRESGGRGGS